MVELDVIVVVVLFCDHSGAIVGALSIIVFIYWISDEAVAVYGRALVQHVNELL